MKNIYNIGIKESTLDYSYVELFDIKRQIGKVFAT